MAFPYSYTNFKSALNDQLHGKNSAIIDLRGLINRAVREGSQFVDLRSTKRKAQLSPGIYTQVYNYAAPADIKDDAIVDVQRQLNRSEDFYLTTPEQFDIRKTHDKNMLAFDDYNGMKMLQISTEVQTLETILNECESITANGTWVASGDATNLAVDTVNFINGSASLKYDLNAGGTTATITNSTQTQVDLTSYNGQSIFVYQRIPLITLLTSFTLKWGSDSSNYWSKTVTTTHEGLSFFLGWNLLRFDWPSSSTGTPDISKIDYLQLIINKGAGMVASVNWNTDFFVARIGDIHNVLYYSRYLWQSNAGVYIADSTADDDVVVAEADEFDYLVKYCARIGAQVARLEVVERKEILDESNTAIELYKTRHMSERKVLINDYYRFASLEGDNDVGLINSSLLNDND